MMVPPRTAKTITAFVDHSLGWNTTVTVTAMEKFTETASPLISNSVSTIFDKKVAVRVSMAMESTYLIKKNTQVADLSVVIPGNPSILNQ